MTLVYIVCATVGGTILLLQFLLQLIGFGDFELDADLDAATDADFDFDNSHTDSSSFFKLLSVKTLTAGVAFFGLTGLFVESLGLSLLISLIAGLIAGLVAAIVVAWLMSLLASLHAEGNIHIENAMGRVGKVYLSIPGKSEGRGKVTVIVQNHSMEYDAVTSDGALSTGSEILVIDIVDDHTLNVVSASELEI